MNFRNAKKKAILALENGRTFSGYGFGNLEIESSGEVVFNTAMTGYQEIMTDPSYKGQIMCFTYPHIGNYGVNPNDVESGALQTEGIIVKEYSSNYSNFRATNSLGTWMEEHNKLGIEGIDTRMLVRILRTEGAMRGIISAKSEDESELVNQARTLVSMEGLDLTAGVTCEKKYIWKPLGEPFEIPTTPSTKRFKVAAYDFGIKRNILRRLSAYGCDVTVYPAHTSADEVLESNPDGIFLSNGPGDPSATKYAIETIKKLAGKKPIFGICLGHQLLGLAFGAQTYKLKFGHRGANHPVKNLITQAIEISSQNHGFAVDINTLPSELEATHINLNDNTLSGFRHRELPIFSVQYHPEASPGPHDSDYLFRQFVEMMSK
ncbi:MAG: glutamine-hydrolyzing carbamoyl-phosphate synthase small subunit [Bacteroidetes bacterium]|nr:glutamine-hydrolyzing carbamoyl-phosphate synthase small subunit [Bacteroidota bacterium]